jgi:hypothetical protein
MATKSKVKATTVPGTRAVSRRIDPGSTAICAHCGEKVKFASRTPTPHRVQVIANVYCGDRWDRVEHFHAGPPPADCYASAGEPHGPPGR